MTDVMKKWEFA